MVSEDEENADDSSEANFETAVSGEDDDTDNDRMCWLRIKSRFFKYVFNVIRCEEGSVLREAGEGI